MTKQISTFDLKTSLKRILMLNLIINLFQNLLVEFLILQIHNVLTLMLVLMECDYTYLEINRHENNHSQD